MKNILIVLLFNFIPLNGICASMYKMFKLSNLETSIFKIDETLNLNEQQKNIYFKLKKQYKDKLDYENLPLLFSSIKFQNYDFVDYSSLENNGILIIKNFKGELKRTDLSPYLGPFHYIPTSELGNATFQLKLNNGIFEFEDFAEKKFWTFKDLFKIYIKIYEIPKLKNIPEMNLYLLELFDPNNFYLKNGLYVIYNAN